MEAELLDVLIEGLFGFRRGLLKQVADFDKAIEKLQTFKEEGGKMPVDHEGLRKVAEELEIERNKKIGNSLGMPRINPNDCDHRFVKGSCEKCSIYEEFAKKSDTIEETDKPDK